MRARIFQFRVIRKFKISHIASKILRIFNRMLVLISLRLWRLESGKISERRCIKPKNFQKFCSKKRLTRLSTATYQLKIFSDSLAEIRFLQFFFLGFQHYWALDHSVKYPQVLQAAIFVHNSWNDLLILLHRQLIQRL